MFKKEKLIFIGFVSLVLSCQKLDSSKSLDKTDKSLTKDTQSVPAVEQRVNEILSQPHSVEVALGPFEQFQFVVCKCSEKKSEPMDCQTLTVLDNDETLDLPEGYCTFAHRACKAQVVTDPDKECGKFEYVSRPMIKRALTQSVLEDLEEEGSTTSPEESQVLEDANAVSGTGVNPGALGAGLVLGISATIVTASGVAWAGFTYHSKVATSPLSAKKGTKELEQSRTKNFLSELPSTSSDATSMKRMVVSSDFDDTLVDGSWHGTENPQLQKQLKQKTVPNSTIDAEFKEFKEKYLKPGAIEATLDLMDHNHWFGINTYNHRYMAVNYYKYAVIEQAGEKYKDLPEPEKESKLAELKKKLGVSEDFKLDYKSMYKTNPMVIPKGLEAHSRFYANMPDEKAKGPLGWLSKEPGWKSVYSDWKNYFNFKKGSGHKAKGMDLFAKLATAQNKVSQSSFEIGAITHMDDDTRAIGQSQVAGKKSGVPSFSLYVDKKGAMVYDGKLTRGHGHVALLQRLAGDPAYAHQFMTSLGQAKRGPKGYGPILTDDIFADEASGRKLLGDKAWKQFSLARSLQKPGGGMSDDLSRLISEMKTNKLRATNFQEVKTWKNLFKRIEAQLKAKKITPAQVTKSFTMEPPKKVSGPQKINKKDFFGGLNTTKNANSYLKSSTFHTIKHKFNSRAWMGAGAAVILGVGSGAVLSHCLKNPEKCGAQKDKDDDK